MIRNQPIRSRNRQALVLLRFHMIIGELGQLIRIADCRQNKKIRDSQGVPGAGKEDRTPDLEITSFALYLLSYTSLSN